MSSAPWSRQIRRLRWYATANGVRIPNTFEITIDTGFDQWSGQCTIKMRALPAFVSEGAFIKVWAELDGYQTLRFSGRVTSLDWSYAPRYIVVRAETRLSILQVPWDKADQTWFNVDPHQIIADILAAYSFDSVAIPYTSIIVDPIEPFVLKRGDNVAQAIQALLEVTGYAIVDMPDGWTRVIRISGNTAATALYTATKDRDILSIIHNRTTNGIINQAIVEGLTYLGIPVSQTASAPNTFLLNPDGTQRYETQRLTTNHIQTDALALTVAQRIVSDKNRRPEGLGLGVRGASVYRPGVTLGVQHPDVEAGNALVLIQHVTDTFTATGWRCALTTTGGNLSGYDATAPFAAMSYQTFAESEEVAGIPEQRVVVVCNASESFASGAAITRYVFSASTGQTQDSDSAYFSFVVPASTTGLSVTLTVYAGTVASTALVTPIDLTANLLYEELYRLRSNALLCSVDGEQTWQSQAPGSGTLTCMAPFANQDGQMAGGTAGLWWTADRCRTALVSRGNPGGGTVGAVWLHEQVAGLIFALYTNGDLYESLDYGLTWQLNGTVDAGITTVKEIRSSPFNPSDLIASANGSFYRSQDRGVSWTIITTGNVAWWSAGGWGNNVFGLLNTTDPARTLPDSGAISNVVFSGTPPTHIRGVTAGYQRPYFVMTDDNAIVYRTTDSAFLAASSVATLTSGVNHLQRSGNAAGVIYAATDNGLQKSPNDGDDWFQVVTDGSANIMVSYGIIAGPPSVIASADLAWATYGDTSGAHGVWAYVDTQWVRRSSGLPSGAYWQTLTASPYNRDWWLLFGNGTTATVYGNDGTYMRMAGALSAYSPLWFSPDAGRTWSQVLIPANLNIENRGQVAWSETTANVFAIPGFDASGYGRLYRGVANGSGATVSAPLIAGAGTFDQVFWLWGGLDDDFVVFNGNGTSASTYTGALGYATASAFVRSSGTRATVAGDVRRLPGSAVTVMVGNASYAVAPDYQLWVSSNYRTSQPTIRSSAYTVRDVAPMADGSLFAVTSNGIQRLTGFVAGTPTATVSLAGVTLGRIKSDGQSRVTVAALATASDVLNVYDGSAWTIVAKPTGTTISETAFEILRG